MRQKYCKILKNQINKSVSNISFGWSLRVLKIPVSWNEKQNNVKYQLGMVTRVRTFISRPVLGSHFLKKCVPNRALFLYVGPFVNPKTIKVSITKVSIEKAWDLNPGIVESILSTRSLTQTIFLQVFNWSQEYLLHFTYTFQVSTWLGPYLGSKQVFVKMSLAWERMKAFWGHRLDTTWTFNSFIRLRFPQSQHFSQLQIIPL